MTAYHEAGHALLSLLIDDVDTFSKVSIIPRGMAGGYTLTPPTEDKHYFNKKELLGQMTVLLGGLIGEELHTKTTSTGVSNDLERVSAIARAMICEYGMSDKLGKMSYGQKERQRFLGKDLREHKDYSESTAKQIDDEIVNLVNLAFNQAKKLLVANRDKLDKIAVTLVEKEVIDIEETRKFLDIPDKKDKSTKNENVKPPQEDKEIS